MLLRVAWACAAYAPKPSTAPVITAKTRLGILIYVFL